MTGRRWFGSTIKMTGSPSIYDDAAYIFSPRLLRTAYAGQCARVKRVGDGAELDIAFVSGFMNESAIASHCGANDGYIRYYNQGTKSGNQPAEFAQKIYDGATGQILKVNGKPCGYFNLNASGYGAQFQWNIASSLPNFLMDKPSMVFVPFQSDYPSATRRGVFGEQRGGTNNIGFLYDTRSNRDAAFYRPDGTLRTIDYNTTPSNAVFHSLAYSNSNAGVINTYLDGTQQTQEVTGMGAVVYPSTSPTSSLQWGMGGSDTNTAFFALGYSPEYVAFDYYDDAKLADVIAEQIAYYGI